MSASPVSGGLLGPVAKPVLPDTDLVPTAHGGGGDESECLRVQLYQVRKNIEPNPSRPNSSKQEQDWDIGLNQMRRRFALRR